MEFRIEKLDSFSICGYSILTDAESSPTDIERLWKRYTDGSSLQPCEVYGVVWYDERNELNYLLGGRYDGELPDGMTAVDIPKGFFTIANMPDGLLETVSQQLLFEKELQENGYLTDTSHVKYFEIYRDGVPCEIWTPVASAQPLSANLRALSAIGGINLAPALKRLNGMQKVLEISAKSVGKSLRERAEKMSELLVNGDYGDFTVMVHGIKSSLAAIGADTLSEKAAVLEREAKAGNIGFCSENYPDFKDGAEKLAEKLNCIFLDSF